MEWETEEWGTGNKERITENRELIMENEEQRTENSFIPVSVKESPF